MQLALVHIDAGLDDGEKIKLIEFINGQFPEKSEVEIYGMNLFQIDSSSLIELLSDQNYSEIEDSEEPNCYSFLESSVGVFRDSCESDFEEMISEMKEAGVYSEQKEWILEEEEKARYFWTIGIGKKDYYK